MQWMACLGVGSMGARSDERRWRAPNRLLCVLVALASVVGCGPTESVPEGREDDEETARIQQEIWNGEVIPVQNIPSGHRHVQFIQDVGTQLRPLGSGTLISDRWILTAGHVVGDYDGTVLPNKTRVSPDLKVRLGKEGTPIEISAANVRFHPKFFHDKKGTARSFTGGTDVALVRLPQTFSNGPPATFRRPISKLPTDQLILEGGNTTCYGYGKSIPSEQFSDS